MLRIFWTLNKKYRENIINMSGILIKSEIASKLRGSNLEENIRELYLESIFLKCYFYVLVGKFIKQ